MAQQNTYLGEFPIDVKDSPYCDYTPKDWALLYIFKYGQIDGGHHKSWVLDQVTRILNGAPVTVTVRRWTDHKDEYSFEVGTSPEYEKWVEDYKDGDEYDYDEGIAP